MCAKMNWDRVRQENRIFRHGSERIECQNVSDLTDLFIPKYKNALPLPNRQPVKVNVIRTSRNLYRSESAPSPTGNAKAINETRVQMSKMPGCSCGKPIGFTASHKKRCPLSSLRTKSHSSYPPVQL